MTNDADFIKDFLIETHENLDKIDAQLLLLEKNSTSPESLADVFRAFHTVKGTARFFEFKKIETLTHSGEDLLSRLRDGRLTFNRNIAEVLLKLVDGVRAALCKIEITGKEGEVDTESLAKTVEQILSERPVDTNTIKQEKKEIQPENVQAVVDSTLRVDVHLLDGLMAEVGELVLTRNHLLQRSAHMGDSVFSVAVQRLNYITSELQGRVMKMRLQPIGSLWSRFPRVVRDLAVALGKEARLVMEGTETELDKSILETIKDPLTHLIRNSMDHGLEAPNARRAAGKPEVGEIRLRAYHEGGIVNIEVSDDGAGLSVEAIRNKGVERGLVTAEAASRMTESELQKLIFLPGFSTAAAITSVSGRGVGLDVVKTNLEKISGSIDIQSVKGQGATFRLKIPLTLAIIPALIVMSRGRLYAIPQANLMELVNLRSGGSGNRIEWIQGVPVYRRREKLLPVLMLNQALGSESAAEEEKFLLVLQAGERCFGLAIEKVVETEEIVVKPLGSHLKSMDFFGGATILGDGQVVLILDVVGLAQSTHVVGNLENPGGHSQTALPAAPTKSTEPMLLLSGTDDGRLAMPLSNVARLEKIPLDALEQAGSEEMIQYRGEILRIVRLDTLLCERRKSSRQPAPESGKLAQIVVCKGTSRRVGLLVHRILDIVEEPLPAGRPGSRPGIKSVVVLRGRVTELLDVEALLSSEIISPPGVGGVAA